MTISPPRSRARWIAPTAAIAVAVLLWWFLTTVLAGEDRLLNSFAPQHAVPAIADLAQRGVLFGDIAASLWRLLAGLLIAAAIGVPLGFAVGSLVALERATRPVFQFLRMVSPLSWAPVAVALFGIGHRPVIFLVAAAALWPIVLNTAAGVHAVDPGHRLVARSLGATRTEVLTSVVLPATRGHVLTGVRVALGIAWVVLVPAEMLGVDSGLGYQILNARDQLAYDQMMAVILVIGVLGYLLDGLARRALTHRRRQNSA
ncbi:NitT/TauT family transport system permease protein [Saccharopolyspora antimicrobica]|uniref:NitT/TauT family transport system permease protein n=1 Tax=Saccharopolyspora antimicrobica TaxID=455193 RepID=A0A1I5GY41_9PSEU|nr:ABC transporter permease [Saccharopolyspora antimicrobica]RKT89256.1 NitT/TauT family transport system permease protein [Saccharopolyspora antimicrobica]SFO40873.1 NitT/TauT family transport system permease protein [Saccharopolyspora antimicrobica]